MKNRIAMILLEWIGHGIDRAGKGDCPFKFYLSRPSGRRGPESHRGSRCKGTGYKLTVAQFHRLSENYAKYVLAQDESSLFLLSREPFKELFRINAERALPAEFTPDSQEITFSTRGLHIERWNIARQELVSAHEVVTEQSIQTLLAPDGRTVVCVYMISDNSPLLAGLRFC